MDMISKTLLFISVFLVQFHSKHVTAFLFTGGELYHFCKNGTLDLSQQNRLSTSSVLSDLTVHSSTYNFYSSSSSGGGLGTTTYGLFYCTGNVTPQDCSSCVQSAANTLKTYCPYYKAAVVFYENCTLSYSNSTLYATVDMSEGVWLYSTLTVSYSGFNETLYATLGSLISEAAYGATTKGFATGEARLVGTTEKLYALSQCTPDILGSPCQECLQEALRKMPGCCNDSILGSQRRSITTFLPSCQLKYEVKTNNGSPSSAPGNIIRYTLMALAVTAFALI